MIYHTDCISASTSTKKCWEDEQSAGVFPLALPAIIHPHHVGFVPSLIASGQQTGCPTSKEVSG